MLGRLTVLVCGVRSIFLLRLVRAGDLLVPTARNFFQGWVLEEFFVYSFEQLY